MKNNALTPLRGLIIFTFLILIGLGVFLFLKPTSLPKAIQLGGDFTLQSADGPVSLSDYRGKVVAMYIGYSACPDVCPTALAIMRQAFVSLPPEQQPFVAGLFVSVDPERDTPEKLKTYTQFFHPALTGVTGTKSEIDEVVALYGAFYRRIAMEDSAMGYAVDHSSRIYLIGPQGKLRNTISHNASPSELIEALQALLPSS